MTNDGQPPQSPIQVTIDKFLTPEAVLTPGGAGFIVMMIAGGISTLVPSMNLLYLMFGLSLLVGTLVFANAGRILHKIVYYILNSFIIYCMAVGAYANITGKTLYPSTETIPSQTIAVPKGVTVFSQEVQTNLNPSQEGATK